MTTCLDDLIASIDAIAEALDQALPDTGWLDWTPTVLQPGSLALDPVHIAKYRVHSGVLDAVINVFLDQQGTSSTAVKVGSLPAQPAQSTLGQPLCYGFFLLEGTTYLVVGTTDGSGNVVFFGGQPSSNVMGVIPTFRLEVGDSIYLNFRYRVEP